MADIYMEEIKKLEHEVGEVKTKVNVMSSNVEKILLLLSGNPLDRNDNGMVGKQSDHDDRINRLERLKDRAIWIMVGAGLVGGGFWTVLKTIFER